MSLLLQIRSLNSFATLDQTDSLPQCLWGGGTLTFVKGNVVRRSKAWKHSPNTSCWPCKHCFLLVGDQGHFKSAFVWRRSKCVQYSLLKGPFAGVFKSAFVSERRNICQYTLKVDLVAYQDLQGQQEVFGECFQAFERLITFPFTKVSVPPPHKHCGRLSVV